jgi:hypothetical protein
MKGLWIKTDWQRAAVAVIAFAPHDASFIAGELRVTKARDAAQRQISAPGTIADLITPDGPTARGGK